VLNDRKTRKNSARWRGLMECPMQNIFIETALTSSPKYSTYKCAPSTRRRISALEMRGWSNWTSSPMNNHSIFRIGRARFKGSPNRIAAMQYIRPGLRDRDQRRQYFASIQLTTGAKLPETS
jgi:hypothetical protein